MQRPTRREKIKENAASDSAELLPVSSFTAHTPTGRGGRDSGHPPRNRASRVVSATFGSRSSRPPLAVLLNRTFTASDLGFAFGLRSRSPSARLAAPPPRPPVAPLPPPPLSLPNKGPGGREGDTRRNGTEPPRSPRPTGGDRPRRSADGTGRTRAQPASEGQRNRRAAPHPRNGAEGTHGNEEAGLWGAWGLEVRTEMQLPLPHTESIGIILGARGIPMRDSHLPTQATPRCWV